MMKHTLVIIEFVGKGLVATRLVGIVLALVSIGFSMADPNHYSHQTMLVKPLYEFTGKLFTELNKQNDLSSKNIILSPVSIHQGLGMVLLGSDAKSETRKEILYAIGYSRLNEKEIQHCHESYGKALDNFKQITKRTLEKRNEFEKSKKEHKSQDEYELSYRQPRSPVIDLFAMMVTKNKGQVKPEFEKSIKKYYHASIGNIDDEKPWTKSDLLKRTNDWGKKAGFAGAIMDEGYLDDDFEALLLSAIRLEAFWADNFDETRGQKIFYNYGSRNNPVDGTALTIKKLKGSSFLEFTSKERATEKHLHEMMSKDTTFNQLSGLNFRAIEIPLVDGLSFAIFEPLVDEAERSSPSATTINQLNNLIDKLISNYAPGEPITKLAKVFELLDRADYNNEPDLFVMPKFKFESDIDLKPALKSVGLKRAFDQKAEITNMTEEALLIKDIKHKAMIETTKTGIKAAGITMIKMSMRMSVFYKSEIRIQNPFMFVVRHNVMPLFVGKLTNLKG